MVHVPTKTDVNICPMHMLIKRLIWWLVLHFFYSMEKHTHTFALVRKSSPYIYNLIDCCYLLLFASSKLQKGRIKAMKGRCYCIQHVKCTTVMNVNVRKLLSVILSFHHYFLSRSVFYPYTKSWFLFQPLIASVKVSSTVVLIAQKCSQTHKRVI